MATPAVSNLSIFQEIQSFYQDRRADLRQLGSALQAGDLNAAQQVYNALVSLGQGGPFSNSEPFAKTDRAQAFDAIGQALQAGDLAGAQAAFGDLRQTLGNHQDNWALRFPAFIVNLGGTQGTAGADTVAAPQSIFQQLQSFRAQRKTDLVQLGKALQSGDVNAAQQAFDALVALGQNSPFRSPGPFRRADRAQDFAAIGQALQNGDLAGAQQAFAALADTFGNRRTLVGLGPLPPIIINLPGKTPRNQEPPTRPPPTMPPPPPVSTLPPTPPPPTSPPVNTLPPTPVPPPQHEPPTIPGGGPVGPSELIINVGGSTAPNGNTPEIVVNLANGPGPSNPEEVQINFGNNGSSGHLTIDVNPAQNGNPGEEVFINFNPGNTNYQLVLNLFNSLSNSHPQSNTLSLQA